MTVKSNIKDLFSSDILLYDELIKAQDDNPTLQEHIISFPSQYKLINEDSGIFIGHGRNVLTKQTSHSDVYDNHIKILISDKNTDYKVAKSNIDLATKELIKTIKNSSLDNKQFRWTESRTHYTSQHKIKYRTLDVIFAEQYSWKKEDEYDKKDLELLFCDPVIDDSDITKEETKFNKIMRLVDEIKDLKNDGIDLLPYLLNDSLF
jgi:hypothetical protein